MGNGAGKLTKCFTGATEDRRRIRRQVASLPVDDTLGHSFRYLRPDEPASTAAAFRISGASVSANASTPLSTADPFAWTNDRSSSFESSTSFASAPLHPGLGPLDRGFLSGPMEGGFMSGPLDKPLSSDSFLRRSFSHGFKPPGPGRKVRSMIRAIPKRILPRRQSNSVVDPVTVTGAEDQSSGLDKGLSVQWAQGRAGEDRVHVVVSEERGWVFVGIYDGFNGPDAPDYLSSNLYGTVHEELKGLLLDNDKNDLKSKKLSVSPVSTSPVLETEYSGFDRIGRARRRGNSKRVYRGGGGAGMRWGERQRRWKCEWDWERVELDKRIRQQRSRSGGGEDHGEVLEALARSLRRVEDAYLDAADEMVEENPELALMGSCVLVVLMKGEDVYVMNVGDSRAVLARRAEPDYGVGKIGQDLERINEETLHDLEYTDEEERSVSVPKLDALQLSADHSTSVDEEVWRIKKEHTDDACAVVNDRVKGSLKVTRAFGAGFLKQPKWNNALLEAFRINYIGNSPYLTCSPSLHHHRLGPNDRFLILSSDGLYQYLTNEEAVHEVEHFITLQPDGDPAQHLVEEALSRAALRAGMDFHELLDIPQGDRRRYHDDISIIVISLEGKIWRSCV